MQPPTAINYATEFSTFGGTTRVSTPRVQRVEPHPGETTFVTMVLALPGEN